MNLRKVHLLIASLMFSAVCASAQVAHFPMSLSGGNITEAVGDHRTRSISLWHDDGETGKTERRTINIDINGSMPKGINHLPYELSAVVDGEEIKFIVTIDVMVK